MHFWKMTAGGNDFILFDNRLSPPLNLSPSDINSLCRRRLSVGADGIILMEKSEQANIKMHYFNADGSSAPLCGNGVRCLARLAFEKKIARGKITIETGAGIIIAEHRGENISLKMLSPRKLELNVTLQLGDKVIEGHFIDVGAPFFLIPYQDIENCPVKELGPSLCRHSFFQSYGGSNVAFFKVMDRGSIRLRVYERGVEEETLSCGTGCLAVSLVAAALGLTEAPIICHTQGGTSIKVNFLYDGEKFSNPSIEGDAKLIYEGKIHPQALKA